MKDYKDWGCTDDSPLNNGWGYKDEPLLLEYDNTDEVDYCGEDEPNSELNKPNQNDKPKPNTTLGGI